MPVPTQAQLEESKKMNQERLNRLQQAYDNFVTEWDGIEKEEKEILEQLRSYVKKSKIHDILNTIHSIKH
ncbi:MAG: hypothetical protein ACD_18C00267G0003 [uncultured bacterium]|nr:MAG: hypothetical protein ACD_18C00267G0003 [uncultured bacterium]OGH83566.1 MAG: hypothetical protein A2488_01965 [Candidatus Magasanikbacteria bacterium RIFOXYC12_FULL_32_21b]HAO52070.1 hypothetical protein [Candidatus Magasanikbacteria bacterium]